MRSLIVGAIAAVITICALLEAAEGPSEEQTEKVGTEAKAGANPAVAARRRDDSQAALARLDDARQKLSSYTSVRAELVETVSIGGRRFEITGSYLQGRDTRLRLEYDIRLDDTEGSFREICDGQVLWTRHLIKHVDATPEELAEQTPVITRRDVHQILDRLATFGHSPRNLVTTELGLGGLPALLTSLAHKVRFDRIDEEIIDGRTFIVLTGGWNKAFLRRLHGIHDVTDKTTREELAARPLPAHVPERIRVFLDSDDFPRRIQYLKRNPVGTHSPMVTLDLAKVVLNGPVDDSEFRYEPPDGVYVNDITQTYLDRMKPSAPTPKP